MGKLIDKLRQECPKCFTMHLPRRLSGKFLDERKERIYMMYCRHCEHIWLDPSVRKRNYRALGKIPIPDKYRKSVD
jgi:hypothetical protein